MERATAKEAAESISIYEMDGKHKPVSHASTNNGTPIYGKIDLIGNSVSESGSYGLNLEFLRAFPDKKAAVNAAKKKWGLKIKPVFIKLNQQFSVIKDGNKDPVAVKKSLVDNEGSLVQEQIQILKIGQLSEQDPAYANETVSARLKTGAYTQENCSRSEYENLQKAKIIPLPNVVSLNLIAERQSRYGENKLIPDSENNIVGKSQINKDIMNSEDWLKAKSGDLEAAERVVDSLWSGKKTNQLKELIRDGKDKVLVTMPSTSGANVLPKVMAQKLAKEFDGKLQVIQGDEFFNLTHNAEVKNISRFDRVFFERKYKTEKPFEKNIEGKKAVLVDDIFTTGGSVKAFSKELSNNKLEVNNVVGLMGDKRFNVDKNTEQKLKTALKDTGIAADLSRLKSLLTRTEAGMLIQRLNREKGLKNEKYRELTKRIQGLYKGIFVKNIRGNRKPGRNKGPGRPHRGNAKNAKGAQSGGSRGGQGR